MKNLLSTIILSLCLLPMAISQQNGSEQGAFLGVSLGLQTSKFKLSDDFQDNFMYEYETSYKFRPKLGFSGAIRAGFAFSQRFSLLSDVAFERSTYRYETIDNFDYQTDSGDSLVGLVKFEETINRIAFPLLARVVVMGDAGGLTLTAGPDFSIGMTGKGNAVLYDGSRTIPIAPSTEFSLGNSRFDEYTGFNVGFVLGLGAVIPLNADNDLRLTFDLRKKWGFTDQYTDERKNYLCQVEGACIQGAKFLRGTYFSVGVEKSFGVY